MNAVLKYVLLPVLILDLGLYVLSVILPRTLLHGHPRRLASFFARSLAYLLALIIAASYGVVISIFFRCVGYAGLGQWSTAWAFDWIMWAFTGVRFELEDPTKALKTRPAVFVGNHQTELDIQFLGAFFPPYCSVTAKRQLKWMPFLGQFMWASKTVFIDRANAKNARAAFDSAAREIRAARQSVFIFVEGTRSYSLTPMLLPFKKGAFHLAVQAQVPIVPIVCENYSHVLVLKGGWKKWKFETGTVRVRVLEKSDTAGLDATSIEDLVNDVRNRMLTQIEELGRERQVAGQSQLQAFNANGKAR